MINFDNMEVEIQCPKCRFYNPISLKQARLRDVVICRGCKVNIRLDDQMNETRKAVRSMRSARKLGISVKGEQKNYHSNQCIQDFMGARREALEMVN